MRSHLKAAGATCVCACVALTTCAAMSVALPADASESSVSPDLVAWVEQTLDRNPELQAAAAFTEAERAQFAGAARPLYHPELELDYEQTDTTMATAELLQPLDWHGKRKAREQVADGSVSVARAEYEAQKEKLTGELLSTLAEYKGNRAMVDLAARQVALLKRFANVARDRGRAGDLGQIEVELAVLAYVESEMAAAANKVALADALDALYRITGVADVPKTGLPQVPAEALPRSAVSGESAARHPDVRAARARARVASAAVRRADTDRRADPTIGIRGGRDEGENLFGLRLVIPLQVRNDFRQAQIRRANRIPSVCRRRQDQACPWKNLKNQIDRFPKKSPE